MDIANFNISLDDWEQFARQTEWDGAPRSSARSIGRQIGDVVPEGTASMSKAVWDSLPWNPMLGYEFQDPDAGDKPTWPDVVSGYAAWITAQGWNPASEAEITINAHRKRLAASRHKVPGGPELHVGHGLGHMAGLAHLIAIARDAGQILPPVFLRAAAGHNPIRLFSDAAVSGVITSLAAASNAVETAHNAIHSDFLRLRDRFEDVANGAVDRLSAALQMRELAETYGERLDAQMQILLDGEFLPPYLEGPNGVKQCLTERLESTAMAAVKRITKSVTQQGIDLPASCLDERRALTQVAKAARLAAQQVMAVEDTRWKKTAGAWAETTDDADHSRDPDLTGDDAPTADIGTDGQTYQQAGSGIPRAKAAYDAGVTAIQAVTANQVPLWVLDGEQSSTGAQLSLNGRDLTVITKNPSGVEGIATISKTKPRTAEGHFPSGYSQHIYRPAADRDSQAVRIRLGAAITAPITVELEATNLCGVSALMVTITPVP